MVKRIITAAVGIALCIGILFLADTPVLPLAISFLIVAALYELLHACECLEFKVHSFGCFAFGAVMPFLCYYVPNIKWRLMLSAVVMILMMTGYVGDHKKLPFAKLSEMITCTIIVSFSLSGLISLYKMSALHGISYIVMTLAAAWLSDSGAYFAGTFFGKHKLCPDISPHKTIEGVIGGVLTNVLVLCLYCLCYQKFDASRGFNFEVNYLVVIIFALISSVLSVFGDLTASLLKREHDIKDYGKIMPGHGGVMDRFDSVLFVVPVSVIMLSFFNFFN